MTTSVSPVPAGRRIFLAMAVGCGVAVANLYYNQPLLGLIAADFGVSPGAVGLVPTATQIGYALGLLLLVPLGDALDRRRLILAQAAALTVALVVMALAPGFSAVLVASVAIGVASTIAQQIIPFAAALADDRSRGQVVGIVMSGLLGGILLARVFSGVIGEHLGWRAAYWAGALLTLGLAAMLGTILPRGGARSDARYLSLLGSIVDVARRHPLLVKSSLVQATQFWGFSVFWSTLALYLEGPPFHLGADAAGLFGVLALVGVFAAPVAGRLADTRGPALVIGAGLVAVALGFIDFAFVPSVAGLVVGVIVVDFGVQLSMVAHQARIFALEPAARSRINTVFMTTLFSVGAVGSAAASVAWVQGGWIAVSMLGLGASVLGLALHVLWRPTT
ncbi:MFS transporter [Zavarzinia sp.]|uniref:MFS transporter n=1 Tax=Zavarzinia sp. TaxID=2027920 RepID=UPI003567ECE0